MKEKVKSCIEWVKEHQNELLIAGLSLTAIVLVILGIRHKDDLSNFMESLKKAINHTHGFKATSKQDSFPHPAMNHSVPQSEIVSHVEKEVQKQLEPVLKQSSQLVAEVLPEAIDMESEHVRAAYSIPFDVHWHIRHLPAGQKHSASAEAIALLYGVELPPSQTIVRSYTKGDRAA